MFAKLRDFFRDTSEPPIDPYVHPVLGELSWSDPEDEGWFGTYGGYRFHLEYSGHVTPEEEVVRYAIEVLSDPSWLESTVAAAKEWKIRELQRQLRSDFYTEEIRELTVETLHFSYGRGVGYIFVTFTGGRDYRCWRLEYEGERCLGLGFDS